MIALNDLLARFWLAALRMSDGFDLMVSRTE